MDDDTPNIFITSNDYAILQIFTGNMLEDDDKS